MSDSLLRVRGLTKRFPGNLALDGVTLTVGRGEVVALLGHNGSGKSTLVKVLSGLYAPDGGDVSTGSPDRPASLHFIHQNLGLISSLSVVENLDLGIRPRFGGLLPFRSARERDRVQRLVAEFGGEFDVDQRVGRLSAAEQTVVAIARAFDGWKDGDNILVLDEPTAALHGEEVLVLHNAVRAMAARGAGVVYISHRLGEVVGLADRVVVLKNGRVVAERERGGFDQSDLVQIIAGGEVTGELRRRSRTVGAPRLTVRGLTGPSLEAIDLVARSGEILGISGLVGSGMEQLNAAIFGAAATTAGDIRVDGDRIERMSPASTIAAGVAFVPADRRGLGSIGQFSARENLTLPRSAELRRRLGGIDRRHERAEADEWMSRLNVLPAGAAEQRFDLFSGGNQQKIVLARWLRLGPGILLLDEPTQGVDAGAQSEIYAHLLAVAEAGAAVVISSSDTKELSAICDRVLVTRDHRIVDELTRGELSESALVRAVVDDNTSAVTESRTP